MIIANFAHKKTTFNDIFSWIKLSFNEQLIDDTEKIIKLYKEEKNNEYHQINSLYTPSAKTIRYYFKEKNEKKVLPSHKIDGEWVSGVGDFSNWLPYRNQDINFCRDQIALFHEGEKACDFARSVGLVSFAFCGAKAKDESFLKNQLSWLKSQGLKGAIYIIDHDKAGEEKAKVLVKVANLIDFPLLAIKIEDLIYPCEKGYDFADLVLEHQKRLKFLDTKECAKEIRKIVETVIEKQLDEIIEQNIELIANIKITAEEAKQEVEKLYQQDIEEADLIIAIDSIYHRLASPLSKSQWDKLCKSIRAKYRYDRIKLEVQRYLQEPDAIKQIDIKNHVCTSYGYSGRDFYKLVDYVDNLERTPAKQFWTVDELIEARKERQNWLIPSFLPQGELLMLAAKSKVGKSLLATEIAIKVLTGGEFLGEKVKTGKVLYTFSDESKTDFGDRIFNLGVDLLPNRSDLIGCSFLDLMDLRKFEEQLDTHRPKLVVIDSLTSTGSNIPFSENEVGFAIYLYRLKDLLQKYGCSCILIHHNNKGNEISGSERLKAACWGTAQMTTEQGTIVNEDEEEDNEWSEDYRFLIMNHTRSTEPAKYKLLINPTQEWIDKGIYEFCGEASDPTGEKREAAEKVLRFLKNNKHDVLTVGEIEQYLHIPKKTVYKALDRLCRRGEVEKSRSTTNSRCWVFQYIKNNSQQGKYSVLADKDNQNGGIDHPPPSEKVKENEILEPETVTSDESQLILTTFSRGENENDRENQVRISETIDTVDIEVDDSHSPQILTEGGGDQNEVLENLESEKSPISLIENNSSFVGLKVKFVSDDCSGIITSEPQKIGSNFMVSVDWVDNEGNEGEGDYWITALISESIDFVAWREDQLNG